MPEKRHRQRGNSPCEKESHCKPGALEAKSGEPHSIRDYGCYFQPSHVTSLVLRSGCLSPAFFPPPCTLKQGTARPCESGSRSPPWRYNPRYDSPG